VPLAKKIRFAKLRSLRDFLNFEIFQKLKIQKSSFAIFRSTEKSKRDDCALMAPIPKGDLQRAFPSCRAFFTADHFFR
jgi:hypothetical protein